MLTGLLSRLEEVHRAVNREELESIYRFRYTVYVEELGREIGGVDHNKKIVFDEEDEKDYALHFYTGSPKAINGVVRICAWDQGKIPREHFKTLSLELFDNIADYSVAEIGRLMIRRSMRGMLILPALMRAVSITLTEEKKTELVFCYCRPGLVPYYKKLGARTYPGNMIEGPEGLEVPLIVILPDLAYFKSVGSPLVPIIKRYIRSFKRKSSSFADIYRVLNKGQVNVETDVSRVWETLQHEFVNAQHKSFSILDSLPDKAVKELSVKGIIMDVAADTLVIREGHAEQEMYIILEGTFEAFSGEQRFEVMGSGDLFGEVAFFREGGRRTASVRALTRGKLMCLRRHFLEELAKKDPMVAYRLLFNLGRLLSNRLVAMDRMLLRQ
jgi:CRP-like cAMP-binding protein/predicted GNAT family N-acyltransferase